MTTSGKRKLPKHNGICLGLAYNSPPPREVVELFRMPLFPVSTPELADLPRPAIVVGSKPCERIASAISAQPDVVYVAVFGDEREVEGGKDWVDDFIVRPEDPRQICHVGEQALVRKRSHYSPRAIVSDSRFAWYGYWVELPPLQAKVVKTLVEAQGAVVREQDLAYELWGRHMKDPGRAIDALIYRIRKSLNKMPGVRLETIRQRGFRLLLSTPELVGKERERPSRRGCRPEGSSSSGCITCDGDA